MGLSHDSEVHRSVTDIPLLTSNEHHFAEIQAWFLFVEVQNPRKHVCCFVFVFFAGIKRKLLILASRGELVLKASIWLGSPQSPFWGNRPLGLSSRGGSRDGSRNLKAIQGLQPLHTPKTGQIARAKSLRSLFTPK